MLRKPLAHTWHSLHHTLQLTLTPPLTFLPTFKKSRPSPLLPPFLGPMWLDLYSLVSAPLTNAARTGSSHHAPPHAGTTLTLRTPPFARP